MIRRLAVFVLLASPAIPAQTAEAPPPAPPSSAPFQLSVNLNLVVLPVTVRDRKGGFASDLTQSDFEIYENGVRQTIKLFRHEDIPVTAGVVVDHSGSMTTKMPNVVAAAEDFVKFSNPQDQMFVVNFNEHASLALPAGMAFTDEPAVMRQAIEDAPPLGQTALYDALDLALDRLREGSADKKTLLVISDGGDNASTETLGNVLKKASRSNASVYTIGIFDPSDPDQNKGVLRKLATETGGEAFFPEKYSDAASICEEIAKDIRHQYTLGYESTDRKAGGYRTVRVVARAKGRKLAVRTRSGYEAE